MKPHDYTRLTREKNSKWLHKDITEKIIGAALEVHKTLGAGFLEYVYQEALCYELKLQNIPFEAQKEIDIWYKDLLIPRKYIPDLLVKDLIVVEIKATKKRLGLLLNFGKESLEIKRRIL